MTSKEKLFAAGMLFAVWMILAAAGLTPVDGLVTAIRDALVALGVFTAANAMPGEK